MCLQSGDYVRQVTPAILSCPVVVAVDSGGTVVLVSQDGIQRPPFRFPKGGHLLQFLSCLENGLLPHGQLDPPLWSQRGKVRGQLWGPRGGWGAASCGVSLGPAFPSETLGVARLGDRWLSEVCPGICSCRGRYFLSCASGAHKDPRSPPLQIKRTTKPPITCSASSTPACSLNSVSNPGPCTHRLLPRTVPKVTVGLWPAEGTQSHECPQCLPPPPQ